MELHVIDKDSLPVGRLAARVGMHTTYGVISRMSEKSVWTIGKSGVEIMHRAYDGRLPSLLAHKLGKADRITAGIAVEK